MSPLRPTTDEQSRRDGVMRLVLDCVEQNQTIRLPKFDPSLARPSDQFALVSVGLESNEFSGSLGPYRYQFEGEEDLLHLIVTRADLGELSTQEGQSVAGFVLRGVPPSLIWLRPGEFSQHFYFGHDELVGKLEF
jgi:hypothetical protein